MGGNDVPYLQVVPPAAELALRDYDVLALAYNVPTVGGFGVEVGWSDLLVDPWQVYPVELFTEDQIVVREGRRKIRLREQELRDLERAILTNAAEVTRRGLRKVDATLLRGWVDF